MRKSKRKIHKQLKRVTILNERIANSVRIGRVDLIELYTTQLHSAQYKLERAEAKAMGVFNV